MKPLNINDLTVEQKIGQMLFARRPLNDEDEQGMLEMVKNHSLGGVHYAAEKLLAKADYPLLVAANMENGFPWGSQFPWPLGMAATDSEELAYEFGRIAAIEAKAAGFNVVFGPVLDIAMNPDSYCVGPRSLGATAEQVARFAVPIIKGYQDNGLVVTGKHYPGFGESAVDSHMGMVYLKGDAKLWQDRELYPYQKALEEATMTGVMTGHIMVPKVDPKYPASLSPALIKLLRDIGFDGLVVTDSFAMVGLTNMFGLEGCHGLAMTAGNDMIIASYRVSAKESYEMMLNAYKKGQVSEEQIHLAATRVLAAQEFTMKPAGLSQIGEVEKRTVQTACEKSITAILKDTDSPAIDPQQKHLFILQIGNNVEDPETGKPYAGRYYFADTETVIRELFPQSNVVKMSEFPCATQIQNRLVTTMEYDSIVVFAFARTHEYTGSSYLTHRMINFMDAIAHKTSAILLMGNPYAANHFPPVPRVLLGFEGIDSKRTILKVLRGDLPATGKPPVPLKLREALD